MKAKLFKNHMKSLRIVIVKKKSLRGQKLWMYLVSFKIPMKSKPIRKC